MLDVAREVGVDRSTVSLALRGDRRISPETQARVAQAAQRLGYMPNQLARSLSGGRTQVIGVMLPTMVNQFYAPHLREIQDGAEAAGLSLTVKFCDWDLASEERGLRHFCESRVDGVIWSPVDRPERDMNALVDKIENAGARCVIIASAELKLNASRVAISQESAVQAGIEYLKKLGHQRIGIATAKDVSGMRSAVHQIRLGVMRMLFAGAGISVADRDIFATSDNEYGGVRLAARIAAMPAEERPTAIFAADDMLARAMVAGFLVHNVRVPQDISVLGFDDAPGDVDSEVAITSVSLQARECGRQLIKLMLELMRRRTDDTAPKTVILEPRIVERDSCDRPRR